MNYSQKSYRSRQLFTRLIGYVAPYKPAFAGGLVATVIMAATQPMLAALMKPLLDGTFVEKDPLLVFWMPIILVALFFVRGLSNYASAMAFAWVSTKVVFDLRQAMFQRLISLPTRFYDHHSSGKLISKITFDVTQVTNTATEVLIVLVRDSIQTIGLIAWVFYLDWQLSLIVFGLIPLIAGVAWVVGKRMRGLTRKLQASFGDMTHVIEETIRGHKVVKIFSGQEYERGRFHDVANWVRRYQMKLQSASSVSVPIVELLGAIAMAVIIYYGTQRTGSDEFSVGSFVSFFAALALLFSPIKRLAKVNEPLQRGLAAAESVFGLVDQKGEKETGATKLEDVQGHIQYQSVTFRYDDGQEKTALNRLDFEILPGQTVALVGASGSGKTTAASILPRLYDVSEGRILIDSHDITELNLATLRKNIALVSQDVVLFNDSVAANIAYGLSPAPAQETIREAARAANALDFIEQMEDGFDTLVGDNGVRLSGGQRQRLAIARALIKDAPILILDEATSALDTESERLVQNALDNLRQGRSTIVIAHRLSTVEKADRILVFQKGKIVESGTHKELLNQSGAYHQLYQTQFGNNP